MAKVLLLVGYFMTGCIASSLIAWFGSLHPGTLRVAAALYILVAVAWVFCWLGDDAISPYFTSKQLNYYACLIGFAAALLVGGFVTWLYP